MDDEIVKKPTLVLGSGLLCDAKIWIHQRKQLSDFARIQIADTFQDDNLQAMALRLLDSAPPTFMYAGFSMGGYLGFELFRQAPDRISRLALLSTTARPDAEKHIKLRKQFIEMTLRGEFEQAVTQNLDIYLNPEMANDSVWREQIGAMARKVGPDVYMRQLHAIVNRPDSASLLPSIDVPTLIICGCNDQLTTVTRHQEMAEHIPDAQLHILDNARHFITLEQPETVTSLLGNWINAE
ncbi:MAG: alpha/beta hydrolase [Gammaproteobacteria bacterium]|jgi:pimeloyl-ACP methyl ester carboxylesterase